MTGVSLLYGYHATTSLYDSDIKNVTFESSGFTLIESKFTISESVISNIYPKSGYEPYIVTFSTDSEIKIENTNFTLSSVPILNGFDSVLSIKDVRLSNITSESILVDLYDAHEISIDGLITSYCETTDNDTIFRFRKSVIDEISNSNFSDTQPLVFKFKNSIVHNFSNNYLDGLFKGIKVENSVMSMSNCTIHNMTQTERQGEIYQSALKGDGSAIEIMDSNMTIEGCVFEDNISVRGGAIFIDCDYHYPCSNSITNNLFKNNTATDEGGAIKYTSYRPTMKNNRYDNNTAVYGNNIASFPVKIKKLNDDQTFDELEHLYEVPSGNPIESSTNLIIVDESEQIMNISTTIKIVPVDSIALILEGAEISVSNGRGVLSNSTFAAEPGRANVEYMLKTGVIDYARLHFIDPVKYTNQIFVVDFRY